MGGVRHIATSLRRRTGRFGRDERGVALVEFAISLPLVLVLFATTIEGGRMLHAYQTTAAGVRDAARYLARVARSDMCNGGTWPAGIDTKLGDIVRESSTGGALFPTGISVTTVTSSLICVAEPSGATFSYRVSPTPVAQVSATLEITFPFANVFRLVGAASLATVTTTVTDQSRIYGT